MKKMHPEFPSDVFLMLETVGARVVIADAVDKVKEVSMQQFLQEDMHRRVLLRVALPAIKSATNHVATYKVGQPTYSSSTWNLFFQGTDRFVHLFAGFLPANFLPPVYLLRLNCPITSSVDNGQIAKHPRIRERWLPVRVCNFC